MYKSVDNDDCLSPVCCAPVIEVTRDQGECREYRSFCSVGWDDPSSLHPQL